MDVATRVRLLALAGIEVRATTAEAGGGGGKTAHEPAGSPKGGQFTSRPGGGGAKTTRRPQRTAAAVPQNVPRAPATPRLVKQGDSGEDVRYAQYAMSLLGFKVAQDGRFGPETAAAVEQIQQRLGVKHPNGHITPALLHKMQDAVRLSPCVGGQRDLAFDAQWEQRDDGLEDGDLDFDEIAEAILDALDGFERSAAGDWAERAAHDVSGELRIPHGKGGGRWTKSPITSAIARALEEWAKGNGPDDPFNVDGKPIDREPLRKAAVARGITLKRGASRDDIVAALKADVTVKVRDAKAAKSPDAGKPVRFTLKGKDHRNLDVGVFTENGKVSLYEVSDSGQRRRRVAVADDLAGLEKWANDHGETQLADWARKERGGAAAPSPAGHGWLADQNRRRDDLRRLVAQGGDEKRLPGGHNADVQLVTTAAGAQYVHKGKVGNRGAGVAEDAEELGALVAQAAGARSPTVVRAPDGTLYEEYVPGRTGYAFTGPDSLKVPQEILDSEQGRRQGLADVIMGISDRSNPGNWLMTDNGDLVGIDHGTAFLHADAPTGNPFTRHLVDRNGSYKANGLSRAELAPVRQRMEELRPEFERLGRLDWWQQSMDRLGEVERHAKAPDVPAKATKAAKKAAPAVPSTTPDLAHLRTLDRETARDQLDLLKVDELKPLLREQGLPVSGKKRELVDRLVESIHGGGAAGVKPTTQASVRDNLRRYSQSDLMKLASSLDIELQQAIKRPGAVLTAKDLRPTMDNPAPFGYRLRTRDELAREIAKAAGSDPKIQAKVESHLETLTPLPARVKPTGPGAVRQGKYDNPAVPARAGTSDSPIRWADGTDPGWDEARTKRARSALRAYGQASFEINESLRGKPVEEPIFPREQTAAHIAAIDDLMAASKTTAPMEQWRGLRDARGMFGDKLDGDLTGMEWKEDAFVSTSSDMRVSQYFATFGGDGMLMRVQVPTGTGAAQVKDSRGEAEALLQRGMKLRIVADHGVQPGWGYRLVDVEVVPNGT